MGLSWYENSTETSATLVGVLVVGENAFETAGKRKEETKADKKEFELELAVKKSESNFVVFTYETENEKGENETKYECEIYEGGKKIQETEFKIEEKDGKTEIKFELEKDGKSDGVEYKIVRRSENKFDIKSRIFLRKNSQTDMYSLIPTDIPNNFKYLAIKNFLNLKKRFFQKNRFFKIQSIIFQILWRRRIRKNRRVL